MRHLGRSRLSVLGALLIGLGLLAGCSSSASTEITPGAGTPSAGTPSAGTPGIATATAPGATATPTAPPHALAWFQEDASGVGQIWASLNGGVAHQITHMPVSSADCLRDEHWGPPIFSPDLTKIVAAWGSADCTDGPETGPLYIINVSSGVATQVPTTISVRLSLREAGWINNTTIWYGDYDSIKQYVVGGGSPSVVGSVGTSYVEDAVLRGNTLFFSARSGSGYVLRRFDMPSHSLLSGTVNLGTINPCVCSKNDALTPGYDVSPDGAHIVFQRVSPVVGTGGDIEGVASSQFFYANADGSGASRIASYATAASMVYMQISPNGALVSVARAEPVPSVFTASVTSPGHSGDPSLHFYTPDGRSYAVWKWDNSQVWAGTKDIDDYVAGAMENFVVGAASGTVGAAGGANPWYTIGS